MNEQENQPLEIVAPGALEVMERAQTDMQISTAKKYPRSMAAVKRDMLSLATLDTETAASCFYTLKRQGAEGEKIIQGPSARLAEIAVNSFGNIKAASRIIDNDGKVIVAQAVCHDLEKNVCISVEVRRRITNKLGKTFSEDMQVVTGNAACSIALRNAVFKVIPMALVKPVYEVAKKTAVGDSKTLVERRTAALKAFEALGVAKNRVLMAVGKAGVEDIGLNELEILIGLHTAIKDGDTTVDEAFPSAASKPSNLGAAPSMFGAGTGQAPEAIKSAKSPVVELRALCAGSGITEAALIRYLATLGTIDETLVTLDEVNDIQPSAITDSIKNWKLIAKAGLKEVAAK